jgi:hypothetical protein
MIRELARQVSGLKIPQPHIYLTIFRGIIFAGWTYPHLFYMRDQRGANSWQASPRLS